MKELIKRLKPDCFDEIVALVALFRPGPLQSGMVDDFIDRKHGKAKIVYPHPLVEEILKPTYGVILYQEQVMQIAQVLSGYSLGGADILRRAMGKKKVEEMAQQRTVFAQGAVKNGVEEKTANGIFDLIEKFAGYGFNKSHSAAYALISYQTAWLKAHYPAEFMAAVLSSDMDNTDKVVMIIDELKSMNLTLNAPNVNESQVRFTVLDSSTMLYGLAAIKGVGEAAVEAILEEREQSEYKDLFEFCQRVDTRKVNRRVIEALISAGAMDGLGAHRASLMASLNKALQTALQNAKANERGQNDLFAEDEVDYSDQFIQAKEWNEKQKLQAENESLGLYFSGHPITRYLPEIKKFIKSPIAELTLRKTGKILIAGLVVSVRVMNTKRGDKIAFMTLDDKSGRIELGVFSECFKTYRHLLAKDQLLVVEAEVSEDRFKGGFRVSCNKIYDIESARGYFAKQLNLNLKKENIDSTFLDTLKIELQPYTQGKCPVHINIQSNEASASLQLGKDWHVKPADDLISSLENLFGEEVVVLEY